MDNRRFDRNADQLSQIFWHYTRLQRQTSHLNMGTGNPSVNYMLELIQKALHVNNDIAELNEKGLI